MHLYTYTSQSHLATIPRKQTRNSVTSINVMPRKLVVFLFPNLPILLERRIAQGQRQQISKCLHMERARIGQISILDDNVTKSSSPTQYLVLNTQLEHSRLL